MKFWYFKIEDYKAIFLDETKKPKLIEVPDLTALVKLADNLWNQNQEDLIITGYAGRHALTSMPRQMKNTVYKKLEMSKVVAQELINYAQERKHKRKVDGT